MTEGLSIAARLTALVGAGVVYLWLLGEALAPWLLPRAWKPFRVVATPFLGWAALVAVIYPLNAAFPARFVLISFGVVAGAAVAMRALKNGMTRPPTSSELWWSPG